MIDFSAFTAENRELFRPRTPQFERSRLISPINSSVFSSPNRAWSIRSSRTPARRPSRSPPRHEGIRPVDPERGRLRLGGRRRRRTLQGQGRRSLTSPPAWTSTPTSWPRRCSACSMARASASMSRCSNRCRGNELPAVPRLRRGTAAEVLVDLRVLSPQIEQRTLRRARPGLRHLLRGPADYYLAQSGAMLDRVLASQRQRP